jgi:hypothetical protein
MSKERKLPQDLYVLMDENGIPYGVFCNQNYGELYGKWLKQKERFKDSSFNLHKTRAIEEGEGDY